jgi:hypothetical protein
VLRDQRRQVREIERGWLVQAGERSSRSGLGTSVAAGRDRLPNGSNSFSRAQSSAGRPAASVTIADSRWDEAFGVGELLAGGLRQRGGQDAVDPVDRRFEGVEEAAGGVPGNPPVMVSNCRRVLAAVSGAIAAACEGSNSATVWSTLPPSPWSMAIPISIDVTLLVTE